MEEKEKKQLNEKETEKVNGGTFEEEFIAYAKSHNYDCPYG